MVIALTLIAGALLAPAAHAEGLPRREAAEGSLYPCDKVGVVRGLVFQDWDQDGERDAEEPALAEATLSLLDPRGIELARAMTGRDGAYLFTDVQPGQYLLLETPPLGYSSLQKTEVVITVKVHDAAKVDFANVLWLLTPGGAAEE